MRGRTRELLSFALGVALALHPSVASAEDGRATATSPEVGTPEAVAAARVHFLKGRELYQAGSYHEAIVELDAARALDPKAKDLVFNLGVVHEKLGEIDEALRYARLYAQMDLEPAEQARAETYIKRLEGAKSEVTARQDAKAATARSSTGSAPPGSAHEHGRLDAATITVGAAAIASAAAGVVFGIKAIGDKPSDISTSAARPLSSYESSQSTAHTEAVVADLFFGGAIAATAAAAILYFARERTPSPTATRSDAARATAKRFELSVMPVALRSGSGLVLGASFQ